MYVEFSEKRLKMAVFPVVLAANLLDHGVVLEGTTYRQLRFRRPCITLQSEINKEFLAHVSTFIARHERFKEELFSDTNKTLSPATWWKSSAKLGFTMISHNFQVPWLKRLHHLQV